jgi:CxxC motif-containing protein
VAEIEGDNVKVTGQTCPKGEQYAIDECKHPVRTVTSIVRVTNREDTMVSCKTEAPVPKDRIFDVMEIIRATTVEAPVHIGDILCDNVFGTRVIATKEIK